jgi:hypothetical protein
MDHPRGFTFCVPSEKRLRFHWAFSGRTFSPKPLAWPVRRMIAMNAMDGLSSEGVNAFRRCLKWSVIIRNFRHTPIRFDEALEVCEDWDIWIALTQTLDYRMSFVNKIATIYHQVPDVVGLVASAQHTSPSKFDLARDYIYAKWPSDDRISDEKNAD